MREQNTIKKKWHKIGVCDDLTSSVQSCVNQLASSAIIVTLTATLSNIRFNRTWLWDFLPIFPKIAVRQTVGGCGASEGNSKSCKPFFPTQNNLNAPFSYPLKEEAQSKYYPIAVDKAVIQHMMLRLEVTRFLRNPSSQFLFWGKRATRIGGSIPEESQFTILVLGEACH